MPRGAKGEKRPADVIGKAVMSCGSRHKLWSADVIRCTVSPVTRSPRAPVHHAAYTTRPCRETLGGMNRGAAWTRGLKVVG